MEIQTTLFQATLVLVGGLFMAGLLNIFIRAVKEVISTIDTREDFRKEVIKDLIQVEMEITLEIERMKKHRNIGKMGCLRRIKDVRFMIENKR